MAESDSGNNNNVLWEHGKKLCLYVFQLMFGGGLIYFLFHDKVPVIVDCLSHFNFSWLLLAIFLYYLHLFVGAWRWYMLARVLKFKLTLWEAICLTMKAFFFSLVIPGGAIGGDLAKVAFLSKRATKGTKVEGAFTILMDRIIGMIALFALAILLTIIATPIIMSIDAPELYEMCRISNRPELIFRCKCAVIAGVLFLCLAGLASCFVMFMHRQLEKLMVVRWGINLLNRFSHGAFARMTAAIDLYRSAPGMLFNMVMISVFLVHLNLVIVVFCLMKGLGVDIVKPLAMVTGVILGNIAGLIPFTISGVGLRDYTIVKFMEASGAAMGQANTTAVLFTSLIIFANISCGVFFFLEKKRKKQQE